VGFFIFLKKGQHGEGQRVQYHPAHLATSSPTLLYQYVSPALPRIVGCISMM
jgi:hypothetical protein